MPGLHYWGLLFFQAVVGVFFFAAAAIRAVAVAHFQLVVANSVGETVAVFVKMNQGFVVALAVAASNGFRFGVRHFKEERGQAVAAVGVEFKRGLNAGATGAGQHAFVGADKGRRGLGGGGFVGVAFWLVAGGKAGAEGEEEGKSVIGLI